MIKTHLKLLLLLVFFDHCELEVQLDEIGPDNRTLLRNK